MVAMNDGFCKFTAYDKNKSFLHIVIIVMYWLLLM